MNYEIFWYGFMVAVFLVVVVSLWALYTIWLIGWVARGFKSLINKEEKEKENEFLQDY